MSTFILNRTITPKRVAADSAMAKIKEDQISLKELEENLTKKQSLLEKQKLDYDENITKKEQLINKVSYIITMYLCVTTTHYYYYSYYSIS